MLNQKEIGKHAAQYLRPMERLIHSRLGRNAVEYAGEALMELLPEYDAKRDPNLEKFLNNKIPLKTIDIMRRFDGRKGTARHAAQSTQSEIEDYDQKSDAAVPSTKDNMAEVLRVINQTKGLPRWMVILRFFGDASNREISRILNVSYRHALRQRPAIQQLLQPCGLHDDLRRPPGKPPLRRSKAAA